MPWLPSRLSLRPLEIMSLLVCVQDPEGKTRSSDQVAEGEVPNPVEISLLFTSVKRLLSLPYTN